MKDSNATAFSRDRRAAHHLALPGDARDLLASSRDSDLDLSRSWAAMPEECLVVDGRTEVSPAQMVESKLMTLLQGTSLPVSHLQMRGLVRSRREG